MYQHRFQAIGPAAQDTPIGPFSMPSRDADVGRGSIAPWAELESCAALPTQLSCFIDAISQTYCAHAVVDVMSGFGSGGAAAAVPLCRDKGYFARWRLVGSREVFEPADALAACPEAMRGLAQVLAAQPRALSFDRVPSDSQLVLALRAAMRGKGWVSVRPAVARPMITLDAGWSDPLSRFNAGRQSDFRRALRKAQRHGSVTFEVLSPIPAEFDCLFAQVVAVELRSWKREAGSALGVDATKQAFFARFLRGACEAGLCRIAFLRIDGRAIAAQVALEWDGRFWLFKIGYDEDYRDCSPGNLLMLHTIGHAAARGLKSYELLGNTERWISLFWTQEQRSCVRVRTYPASLRGLCALAADAGEWLACRLSRGQR